MKNRLLPTLAILLLSAPLHAADAIKPVAVKTFDGLTNNPHAIWVSADGKRVLATGDDKTLRIWDLASGQPTLKVDLTSQPKAVCQTADGKFIVTAGNRGPAEIRDAATGTVVKTLAKDTNVAGFSPDGSVAAMTIIDPNGPNITLFAIPSGQIITKVTPPEDAASLSLSKGGALLAVGTFGQAPGQNVLLFDGHSGLARARFRHDTGQVVVAISPDGNTLITSGESPTNQGARLWNIRTGASVKVDGTGEDNAHLAFAPNMKTVVEAGATGTCFIDLATKKVVAQYGGGPDATVNAITFTPDSKQVLAALGGTYKIVLWPIPAQ